MPGALGALPPQHAAAMQQAMRALASGQAPQLLEQVSGKMGLPPDQLRQTAAAIAAGEGEAIPAEVVQRAMQLQWALRNGAVPPMGLAAAAAVPPGAAPGLLGSVHGMPPGAAGHAAAAAAAAGMPAGPQHAHAHDHAHGHAHAHDQLQPLPPGGLLLVEGEEQQGCFELYRRAYGRHLDAAFPPAYVAGAALAFSSGFLPFWLGLLLVPAGFVLGVQLLLVKGELAAGGRAAGVAHAAVRARGVNVSRHPCAARQRR